jgi:hypothetical protein
LPQAGLGFFLAFGVNGLGGFFSVRASTASRELSGDFVMSDETRATIIFPMALYRTTIREAKIYADLLSTQDDMRHAREFVEEGIRRHGAHDILARALFSGSHISYRRCFNRGSLGLGKSQVSQLTSEQREIHDYHLAQADKLLAHSVNRYEMVEVGIALDGDKINVGHIAARLVGLDKPDLEKWLALIEYWQTIVLGPMVEKAGKATLERAQQIPRHDILRGGLIQPPPPSRATAHKRR